MVESVWHILLELAPWLFVGVVIAGALHALLPADFIRRHLSGRWGVLKAALVGVPMPLCSCSVIPVGLGLKRQGASDGAVVSFLTSTPQTGVDSVLVTAAFLGWPFTLFKMASAFVIGLVGGCWTDSAGPASPTVDQTGPTCDAHSGNRLRDAANYALMLIRSVWGWLVVGIVVSAAIEVFIPPGSLDRFTAFGGLSAMLLALVIGMPMYVCSLSAVPIAAALVTRGFPPAAALVFLIAGPATNLATIGAVYRTLGRRTLLVYLTSIAAGSMLCGWAFGFLLDPVGGHAHGEHLHGGPAWWAMASAVALCGLLAWFALDDAMKLLRRRPAKPAAAASAGEPLPASVEVHIEGMTCQNCVAKLERALGREKGVWGVSVSLDPGRAVVHGDVTVSRVRELIHRAGFHAV